MSSFFPARVPGLRTGKNDTIRGAPEAPEAQHQIDRIALVRMKKKTSFLEANRAKPSCRMKKQVPKNGILDATVDSQKGFKGSLREFV